MEREKEAFKTVRIEDCSTEAEGYLGIGKRNLRLSCWCVIPEQENNLQTTIHGTRTKKTKYKDKISNSKGGVDTLFLKIIHRPVKRKRKGGEKKQDPRVKVRARTQTKPNQTKPKFKTTQYTTERKKETSEKKNRKPNQHTKIQRILLPQHRLQALTSQDRIRRPIPNKLIQRPPCLSTIQLILLLKRLIPSFSNHTALVHERRETLFFFSGFELGVQG
ncbi:hypothetical protein BKA61DRAFT_43023 [Leptodontidium sp. MPI-SDFR-AT-0119]|nr:hypothetical protein BKA61DRAFT_43023 [Leptodontidium sp. MPI-SDFR-AT-0119]